MERRSPVWESVESEQGSCRLAETSTFVPADKKQSMPRKPAVQSQFARAANEQRQVSGEKCERELDSVRQEEAVGHVHRNDRDCHDGGQEQGRIASQQKRRHLRL